MSRHALELALAAENIDTRKYYDPPVHRHTAYQHYYDAQPLPETDWLAAHSLSLPMWSNMGTDTALRICEAIERIQQHAKDIQQRIPSGD